MKIYRKCLVIGVMILFFGASIGASVGLNIDDEKDQVNSINPSNENKQSQTNRAWSDNFDSYETGSPLHGQGGWEAWDNNPVTTAYVSDTQSLSLPNSVEIAWFDGNSADIVQQFTDVNTGNWRLMAWQFVPSDMVGSTFFILMNTYTHGGPHESPDWSCQIRFSASEGIVVDYNDASAELPIITDEWVLIRVDIDFEADWQEVYYGGDLLQAKSWSEGVAQGGAVNLACIDLYADQTESSSVYYDDMSLDLPQPLSCDANGPYSGNVNEEIEFYASAFGGVPPYEYQWEFGDDETSNEQNPIHAYSNPGEYTVKLTVTDSEDDTASDTTTALINSPPDTPEIDGSTSGSPNILYTYKFTTTDPDNHDVYFIIDWDDGSPEETIGPVPSGTEDSAMHVWTKEGTYTIKAKARDIYDAESGWAELDVVITKSRDVNKSFIQFLQNYLNFFPILKMLLHRFELL